MTARSIGTSATSVPVSSACARSATSSPTCRVATAMSVSARPDARRRRGGRAGPPQATRSSSWRRSAAQHPDARLRVGGPAGRLPPRARRARAARARLELGVVGQEPQRLRRAGEQRGDVLAGAEQLGQPLGHLPLVAQQPEEPLVAAQRLADLPVGQQAGVGVGAGGEGLQQHRQQVLLHRRRPATPRRSARPGAAARPSGSAKPSARSQSPAAFEPSCSCSPGTRATADSSGR